jgi:hypothetical protein
MTFDKVAPVVSLLLTAAAAIFAGWSAKEASEQARAASEANRPWIKVNSVDLGHFLIGKQFIEGSLDVTVQNKGHYPAQGLHTSTRLLLFYSERRDDSQFQKNFCLQADEQYKSLGFLLGAINFPDDSVKLFASFGRQKQEMENLLLKEKQKDLRTLLELVGCVTYTWSDAKLHHTSFLVGFRNVSAPTQDSAFSGTLGDPIDLGQDDPIVLQPFLQTYNGGFAD